ncbi:Alpha/Beta hydrolase protein [Dactylonectria estremocensis]|uniref:Alpha/Beta hydrolase protein n=1 Tax=Dactylonectria estremocensis TaxID=1079267 RepID=A0A9P9ESV1_9HYPO|nr:Alpha/Beta hydrolase protein [Dactylonectria estremocensis]
MATLLPELQGYQSRTFIYKVVSNLELKPDVMFPLEPGPAASPVLLHYHGGFLIIGNCYSLLPYWLIKACVSRNWIFVTADCRLIPETTAHNSVEDAVDAYDWVPRRLTGILNISTGPVILAGSSAGAYLALTAASAALTPPRALPLLYGLLDPTNERYTTKGTNVLGLPPVDSRPVLEAFAFTGDNNAVILPGHGWPEDLLSDPRFALIQTARIEAQISDIMTGVNGISEAIAKHGPDAAITASEPKLFPNDAGVPFTISQLTAEKLKKCGVEVFSEFPDDAQHGFDVLLGLLDLDEATAQVTITPSIKSLQRVLQFLDLMMQ